MVVSLNANLASLRVGRQLDITSRELSSTFERLSSGLRINKAGDDPAGLAVAAGLKVDQQILNRARLNIGDSVSLLNITDGALGEISTLLTRMAELASQSSNGVFSNRQRTALDEEYRALDQEIRRIGSSTQFNGLNVLGSGKYTSSDELVYNGDGGLNPSSLTPGSGSSKGRYIETNLGLFAEGIVYILDTETNEALTINMVNDPELGALDNSDLLAITDDGLAIIEAETQTGNNVNLYSYDLNTNTLTRLTDSQTTDVYNRNNVALSADGNTLVFSSQTLYENGSAANNSQGTAGGYQAYALDLTTGIIRSQGELLSARFAFATVSADGTQIAFTTFDDVNNPQYIDAGGASLTKPINAEDTLGITITKASLVGIQNNGNIIVTSANDLGVGNTNNNVFSFNLANQTLNRITDLGPAANFDRGVLSADGTIVRTVSSGDFVGENSTGSDQVFEIDLSTGDVAQLTNTELNFGNYVITFGDTVWFDDSVNDDIYKTTFTENASEFDFEAGFGAEGRILVSLASLRETLDFLGDEVLSTQSSALNALTSVKEGIDALSALRGEIGAGLSRLNVANQVISSQATAFESARARIVDADIALETANLTRLSILQQASTALMAQANQQTSVALRLINSG